MEPCNLHKQKQNNPACYNKLTNCLPTAMYERCYKNWPIQYLD